MNERKNNYEINISDIMEILIKRWWIIAIIAALCVGIVFCYTYFMVEPTYEASVTMLIDGGSSITTTYQDILAGQYQSKDYPYILNANLTLEELAKKLNENDFSQNNGVPYREYTADVLAGMISNESINESRIFIVTVKSTNPDEAALIANEIPEVFKNRIEKLIRGGSVGDVGTAVVPKSPSSPNYSTNMVLGLIVGLAVGVVVSLIFGLTNDVIESEDWLVQSFHDDIPVLSVIPDSSVRPGRQKYYYGKYEYGNYKSIKESKDKT